MEVLNLALVQISQLCEVFTLAEALLDALY